MLGHVQRSGRCTVAREGGETKREQCPRGQGKHAVQEERSNLLCQLLLKGSERSELRNRATNCPSLPRTLLGLALKLEWLVTPPVRNGHWAYWSRMI